MTATHSRQPSAAAHARTPRRRPVLIASAGLVALVLIVVVIVVSMGGARPSWRASVQGYAVIDPAELAVTVRVTNTGGAAGSPTCSVVAQDPSGAYRGVDAATLKTVAAGSSGVWLEHVTITSQGAHYVTQVSASCQ